MLGWFLSNADETAFHFFVDIRVGPRHGAKFRYTKTSISGSKYGIGVEKPLTVPSRRAHAQAEMVRWSANAVGCPGLPHSDSVFRSNTSTDQTSRDQTCFGWRRGVVHLHSPLPARSRQAGATVRRRRPFAADEPRHLQRHREHLAAARIHTPGRQARRRCSIPQRYFSMHVP